MSASELLTHATQDLQGLQELLVAKANEARLRAYAPYSKFLVGAAVLCHDGQVFSGCNVENASYGATVCAERVAIWSAIAAGARQIVAVAVVADTPAPVAPCGMCRQVMHEFAGQDRCIVFLANLAGQVQQVSLAELLPFGFILPSHSNE